MGKASQPISHLEDRYERPGKRRFTRLLLDLLARDECHTFGTLWGAGGEARLAVAAGFEVVAVDNDPAVESAMREDAERVGYAAFAGNARQIRRRSDAWHADFMGTPNPDNFRTIQHLARITDKWLAVTVATDHIHNPEMQNGAIVATLPAWLTYAAEGFTLEYLSTYTRNERGLRMWVALLRRRAGHGNSHRVQPVQIGWSMSHRGYWASSAMFDDFPGLLPHLTPFASDDRRQYLRRRYAINRDELLAKSREYYAANAAEINARKRERRSADPEYAEKSRTYQREWHARNRKRYRTPEKLAARKEYRRKWYLEHREQQIEAAAERRKRLRATAAVSAA